MTAPTRVGTVAVLRDRLYPTEVGWMAVTPGEYPIMRYIDGSGYFFQLRGRRVKPGEATTQRLGPGLFAMNRSPDMPYGPVRTFPGPHYSPADFAELLEHPEATEGAREQRIRIRLDTGAEGSR